MNTIREYSQPLTWTEQAPNPGDVEYIQELNGLHYYMIGQSGYDGGGRLIGSWSLDGEPLQEPDPKYIELLALGNISGLAHTPALINWQGRSKRLVQDPETAIGLPEYPADQQPFDIEIRRYERTVNTIDEWAWRAELHKDNIDPDDRAIAMYSGPEFAPEQYAGTTGGFVQLESLWQTDENGDPATVWGADCPFGSADPAPVELYLALWRSEFKSGIIIPEGADGRGTFWEFEQGGGGDTWIDSGETYQGIGGANYILVSGTDPFSVSQQIRLDGTIYTISQIFAGAGLVIDGTPSGVAVGTPIEIQQ